MRNLILALSLLMTAPTVSLAAERSAEQDCADLAAYIWEPGFRETGVAWDKIDVAAAMPVCVTAHANAPEHAPTQYRLGRIYLQQDDFERALPLLLESAEAGYAPAQTAYGTLFMDGKQTADYPLAFHWLSAAAAQNNPVAKANLGILYYHGQGVAADTEVYIRLQVEAAQAGADFAQYHVGDLFEIGFGVEQDMLRAEAWYRLAAAQGHMLAQRRLGKMLGRRDRAVEEHTEAIGLLTAAAEQGDGSAATHLGWMLAEGIGTDSNLALARERYDQGLRLGDFGAARFLGHLYEYGKGVEVDHRIALANYLLAAWAGDMDAQYKVGVYISAGRGGILRDRAAGLQWYLRAAQQGHVEAQMGAAQAYTIRFHDQPAPLYDAEQGHYWYVVAAANGNLKAALQAALIYAGKRDFATANAYVVHVMESGDAEMVEEAMHTIDAINMVRYGTKMPV
ncbi:MAG: tetratricopeptide repeat protein [Candidatus Devosia phytovorans]|uniref:Tetratricopeptide repeat protein n=1 Tax=Candidatus Devosia phytovorans TaxID=3121372 RepID=A0AAJ6B1A1_9HYPH|nr:tetratricopeptide repeat protein [Devosia sp.]WEK05124.1 MAG: tetratricopeptide repeat protein [Devosia sp.]